MLFLRSRGLSAFHRAVLAGFAMGALLCATVVLTGNTFGQRCATAFPEGSADWKSCVDRLSNGGRVQITTPHSGTPVGPSSLT